MYFGERGGRGRGCLAFWIKKPRNVIREICVGDGLFWIWHFPRDSLLEASFFDWYRNDTELLGRDPEITSLMAAAEGKLLAMAPCLRLESIVEHFAGLGRFLSPSLNVFIVIFHACLSFSIHHNILMKQTP